MYNGTFVIGIRLSSAYAEIIFTADSILQQPAEKQLLTDDLERDWCYGCWSAGGGEKAVGRSHVSG